MKNSVLSIITAACLLISTAVMAQAPQAFNYQAVARNSSGQILANQNVNVRITIRTGTATGTNVYQEKHQATTNQFGLFTLAVGKGDLPTSTFANITWGSNKHFMQVEMDPAAGGNYQDLGTSELLSVPYALVAGSVAGGGSSPWTTTGNNISNSNSGNVGIGIANPTNKLHVRSDGNDGGIFSTALLAQNNTGFQDALRVRLKDFFVDIAADYTGTAHDANLTFSTRKSGQPLTERMRITESGKVGIGTTALSSKFTVIDSTTSGVVLLKKAGRNNNGPSEMLRMETDSIRGGSDVISLSVPSTAPSDAQFIEFERGGTPVARINTNGDFNTDGEYQRTQTGAANMVPIAYGFVSSTGAVGTLAKTSNVTSIWNATSIRYEITITGENYDLNEYVTLVTPVNSTTAYFAATQSANNKLYVYIRNTAGTAVQSAFNFIVFKP